MILGFYGKKVEEKARLLLKSTPLRGTYWEYAADGLKELSFDFVYSKKETFEYLKKADTEE